MILEHDDFVSQFTHLLDRETRGRGAIATITGGVGFGKTTLLETIAERALSIGYTVLNATGSRAENSFPYGAIGQLFRPEVLGSDSELPRMLAAASRSPGAGQSPNPEEMMNAIYRSLVDISASGPVFISVDDAHYCDAESMACLLYLIRRASWLPVVIGLTYGTVGTAERQIELAELACRPGILHIRLTPLNQAAVTELATSALGEAAAGRHAAGVYRSSGGNPLLAQALIRDIQCRPPEQGSGCDSPVAGDDVFREASLACVHRSGAHGLRVARGIAVLESANSPELLSVLTGLDERAISFAMRSLTDSCLIDGGQFRHPVIRTAVLEDIPAADRTRLHHQAGWLRRVQGASAVVVAKHLLAGGSVKEEWAPTLLVEAAEQCLADDDVPMVTRCLQLADACCVEPRQRHLIRATLARAMSRDRPEASTRIMLTLVNAARAGEVEDVTRLRVGHGLLMRGRLEEALEVAGPVFSAELSGDPNVDLERDIARLWLASTYPGASKRLEPGLAPPVLPRQDPEHPTGIPRLVANECLWTVLKRGGDDALATRAERVLQSLPIGDGTIDTLKSAIMALIYADRLTTAGRWCDQLLTRAENRPVRAWQAYLRYMRSMISLREGSLRNAADSARAALESMSEEAWGVEIGMPLATLIEALTAIGDHEAARDLVDVPVCEALFQTRFGLHYLYARGRHHLATGYHEAALADFLGCGEKARVWELDSPALAPWRIGAAQCYLRRQEPEKARRLADEHATLAKHAQQRTRGAALRAQAATRSSSQRLELLNAAREVLQAGGDRYELALTLADLGRAHQRHGADGKARLMVRQARYLAEQCGAEQLSAALTPKTVGNATGRPRCASTAEDGQKPIPLSDAEHRVMALASQGFTNREISSKLFITVSTVEQHLTRVYRKLNIRARQELPANFAS